MKWVKGLLLLFLAAAFTGVGANHFVDPELYVSIVPPYLPYPYELVYISGFFEMLGGIGLLVPQLRKAAAWGLLALLVAVYPANIHMLVNEVYLENMRQEKWILWVRMPLQFVAAAGVAWVGGIIGKAEQNPEGVEP